MGYTNGYTSIQNKMGSSEAFVLGFNRDSWLDIDSCRRFGFLDNQLVGWINKSKGVIGVTLPMFPILDL